MFCTTFFWRYGGKSSSTHTPHLQATMQWKTFLREPRHEFFHSKSPRMLGFFYTQYLRRYAQHYIQYFSTTMRDFSFFNKKEKFSHSKSKFASKNKNRHILMCVNALILFLYLMAYLKVWQRYAVLVLLLVDKESKRNNLKIFVWKAEHTSDITQGCQNIDSEHPYRLQG